MITINFSDSSILSIKVEDVILVLKDNSLEPCDIQNHHNLGPIPSLLKALTDVEYFAVSDDIKVFYNARHIVSIQYLSE